MNDYNINFEEDKGSYSPKTAPNHAQNAEQHHVNFC